MVRYVRFVPHLYRTRYRTIIKTTYYFFVDVVPVRVVPYDRSYVVRYLPYQVLPYLLLYGTYRYPYDVLLLRYLTVLRYLVLLYVTYDFSICCPVALACVIMMIKESRTPWC